MSNKKWYSLKEVAGQSTTLPDVSKALDAMLKALKSASKVFDVVSKTLEIVFKVLEAVYKTLPASAKTLLGTNTMPGKPDKTGKAANRLPGAIAQI